MSELVLRPGYLALLLLCALLFQEAAAAKGIKCWHNRDGVRECGNVIPPEYAQKETQTISEQGITIEVKQRAPTAEEVREMRERERIERELREAEEKRHQRQEAYDMVLLASFTTERDLLISRDQKLAAVEANIELTYLTIDKLKENLIKLNRQAAMHERRREAIPEHLNEDIERLNQQIANKLMHITDQQAKRQAYVDEYHGYLERFRELSLGAPVGSDPKIWQAHEENGKSDKRAN